MEFGESLVYQAQVASLKMVGKDLHIMLLGTSYSIMRVLKLSKYLQGSVELL